MQCYRLGASFAIWKVTHRVSALLCFAFNRPRYEVWLHHGRSFSIADDRLNAVQACRDRSPVSPESSTDVPHRLLRSSVRHCPLPAPAIRQPPSTDCSTCPLQHLQLSLLRFCWYHRIHCLTICAIPLLDQSSFDPPVCLLLAFR